MFWYLQHLYASGSMHAYHTQHTGVARFQWTTFSEREPLELPPLPVQRRIAGILSPYDELIENSQRRIRALDAMACSIYREWLIYFRFPGHEKIPLVTSPIGDIPNGWETVSLSSLVDFAKGRKPTETRTESLPGDVKLLLIDSLRGGQPVFTAPAKLVLAESRDTLMVMDGGSSCDVTMGASGAVGSTLGRFRTTRPKVFSPHALYRFLEAKAEEFKSKNIGAAIPHANKDYILSQLIALPPEKIAASFNEQLEPIQSTIETLKSQIQNLRRTRDLLLPRLLSGQINLAEN
jgi:type I restriction enzyme S subunit